MLNPAAYTLGILQITAANTYVTDWTTDLDGMKGVTLQVALAYGSGGSTLKVYVQTSLDAGVTAIDIACVTYTTAGGVKLVNLADVSVTTAVVPTDGALADNTVLNGILGDRLRFKVISTGTYAGSTTASVRASTR